MEQHFSIDLFMSASSLRRIKIFLAAATGGVRLLDSIIALNNFDGDLKGRFYDVPPSLERYL